MECNKCEVAISDGDEREHKREILCEDCYIDVISPAIVCDPWADYTARSFYENTPNIGLNANQSLIMKALKECGEIDPIFLIGKLKDQITSEDCVKGFTALHQMGKINVETKDRKTLIKLK